MGVASARRSAYPLVSTLRSYRGKRPIVLALAPGGLRLARAVASGLGGEANLFLSRSVDTGGSTAPGFVWETGQMRFDTSPTGDPRSERGLAARMLAALWDVQLDRRHQSPHSPAPDPAGRVVILVSDGIASGSRFLSALRALKALAPTEVVAAVVAGCRQVLARVREEAAEVVCLRACDTRREVSRSCRAQRSRRGRREVSPAGASVSRMAPPRDLQGPGSGKGSL
jgi:predicted phosphoribosyltransferase